MYIHNGRRCTGRLLSAVVPAFDCLQGGRSG